MTLVLTYSGRAIRMTGQSNESKTKGISPSYRGKGGGIYCAISRLATSIEA